MRWKISDVLLGDAILEGFGGTMDLRDFYIFKGSKDELLGIIG